MNSADGKTLPSILVPWAHYDGSTGKHLVSERQYLESTYTFGPSDKCKVTLEFHNLLIPGLVDIPGDSSMYTEGAQWLHLVFPDSLNPTNIFYIASGFFDFNADSGQPTTGFYYTPRYSVLASSASWSTFSNIDRETFLLQVTLNRATIHPDITVDFRSQNITLVDNIQLVGEQPDDAQIPDTFTFRTGSRMLPIINPNGAYNHIITKFYCESVG